MGRGQPEQPGDVLERTEALRGGAPALREGPGVGGRAQEEELFVVRSLRSIAGCLSKLRRYEEALPRTQEAAARAQKLPGDPSFEIALCDLRLAECRRGLGDLAQAERLCRSALASQQAGPRSLHPEVADSMVLLGGILADAGRTAEAERWLREALRLREAALPAEHYLIVEARDSLRRLHAVPGGDE